MQITTRDHARERRIFQGRAWTALAGVVVLLGMVAGQLVNLQVFGYEHFATLSKGNRIQLQPQPPTRGLLYDRDGRVLAENLPSFRLDVTPEKIDDLEKTLDRLSGIVEIEEADRQRLRRELDRRRRFEAVPVRYRLTESELAAFAVNRTRFPGVRVRANLTRHYPHDELAAQVLGYVSAIDKGDLEDFDPSDYAGSLRIGQTGIERAYERTLHGEPGQQRVEVTAQGRIVRTVDVEPPRPGKNLHLTLDLELQRVARDALDGRSGAVVAIQPATGEVLAMVSTPGFDPNRFVAGMNSERYQALVDDPRDPLTNRAIRGRYPPGSVVKPFLGFGDLEEGRPLGRDGISCNGVFRLPGTSYRYRDWKVHGRTDLTKAIAESCDVYFYRLALELGIQRMGEVLADFGFGSPTGIDLGNERGGLVPSPEWKRRARGEPWYRGETVITGIGQGFTLVTPLQLAQATATIARRGTRIEPHLVRAIENRSTGKLQHPRGETRQPVRLSDGAYWERIIDAMEDVVHGEQGTARSIGWDASYRMAGKTGTAQVFGLEEDEEYDEETVADHLRDHALFVSFAPVDAPRIATAVVVEHGGGGSAAAAPVARTVMDAYLTEGGDG